MISLKSFGLISLAICGLCYGQEIGECSSPDLTNDDFLFGVINDANINVSHSGVIKEYDMVNTVSVISSNNNPLSGTYINARYDASARRLQIFATEQLAEYEQRESATSIQLTMMLGCTGGSRRLIFEQPLNEENNHDPVFSKELYEFEVMLPLPRGFDLTFFQEVSARDLDIRNNQVHFSSPDAEVISVGTARRVGDDGKTFYASMITVHQLLSVGDQLEFTIVATDSGTPPRSTQSRVIVRSDADDVFIPVPKFENAFYRGEIDNERRLIIDQLRLTENTYHKEIALGFSGGDSALFTLSIDDVTTLITISFQRPLTDQNIANRSILLTTLVANRADVDRGSTVIIVDIPLPKSEEPELPVPQFEHNVYVGQLNEQRALSVPEVTILENTFVPELVVSLSGKDAALFRIENTNNAFRVTLTRDLQELDVQFRTYLAANLTATRPDVEGFGDAALLVNIAASVMKPIPRFERSIYAGEVDSATKNLVSEITLVLNASTYSSDIVFSLNGGDADLFSIEDNRNTPNVMLVNSLTDDQMQRTMLTTTVWARRENDDIFASTEIIVTTPIDLNVLQFLEPIYLGQINVERTLSLPLITINIDTYTDDVTFTLIGDDTNLLQLTSNRNIVSIMLNREITDIDLISQTYLKFILQANNNLQQTASAILLIDIIKQDDEDLKLLPAFEKLIYIGELDDNRRLLIEDIILSVDTFSSDIQFSLSEGNSSLFGARNFENAITINLLRELTELEIVGTSFLSAVLKAYRPNVGESTTTILIRLSDYQIIKPKFEQSLYLGNLSATDGTLSYDLSPKIEASTYNPEVKFSLMGADAELFTLQNELSTIEIQLSRQLTEVEKLKPVLMATIIATSSTGQQGTTEWFVIQEQTMLAGQPIFEHMLYTGEIDATGKLVEIPLIRLTSPSTTNGLRFDLLDADSNALVITVNDAEVSITLSRDLNAEEMARYMYLKAFVVVTNTARNLSTTAILIIDITQPAIRPAPQFVQDVYRGWLDSERILIFEDVRVLPETFTNDVALSLRDDDYALFTATKTQNNVINIALASPLTDSDLDNRTYLTTVINANRPDVGQSSALLLVHLHLTTPRPPIPLPQFSQPVFRGRIGKDLQLQAMEDITLVSSTFVPGATTFQLIGEDTLLFESTVNAHELKLTLRPGLSVAQLADKDYLSFRVVASHPETPHSSAAVLIDLPPKVCPVDETPIFENSVYQLTIATTQTGQIGQVIARVPGSDARVLQYALISIPADLSGRLDIDLTSGELSLSSTLSVGEYPIQVAALDSSTGLQGIASIRLIVTTVPICPPDLLGHHVNYSLQIVYLIENQEHLDIMPSTIDECTFEVVKMIPSDMNYVSIDSTTQMLRSIKLDREADIFASMAVPQIQVSLQLVCAEDVEISDRSALSNYSSSNLKSPLMPRSLNPVTTDGRWYTLTNSLSYSPWATQLTIIIEDENDNFPTFITPIVNELLYGYPDAPLAEIIMPVQLLQVRAIDRDAGLNAKIWYTLESNRHFQINGESGVVTPVRDAFTATGETEEVSLVIRATDRNGSADGLTTERTLRVHRLRVQQIVVISVEEQEVADDVDRVVDQVYANVGLELMVLHAARITVSADPIRSFGSRQSSASAVNVLRMFAYVVRDNVAIMEATDVQKSLSNFDANIYNLSTMTLSQHQQITVVETVQNREQLALVIVCVVLGVLLLMTVIATFLMWWYKIRPYEYRKMLDDESVGQDETPVSSTMGQQTARIGAIGLSGLDLNGSDPSKAKIENAVFQLDGTTTQETTDDTLNAQLSRYLSNRVDKVNNSTTAVPLPPPLPPPPPQPTQLSSIGVRFNELVERIDIVVEPEAEHFDSDREENTRA